MDTNEPKMSEYDPLTHWRGEHDIKRFEDLPSADLYDIVWSRLVDPDCRGFIPLDKAEAAYRLIFAEAIKRARREEGTTRFNRARIIKGAKYHVGLLMRINDSDLPALCADVCSDFGFNLSACERTVGVIVGLHPEEYTVDLAVFPWMVTEFTEYLRKNNPTWKPSDKAEAPKAAEPVTMRMRVWSEFGRVIGADATFPKAGYLPLSPSEPGYGDHAGVLQVDKRCTHVGDVVSAESEAFSYGGWSCVYGMVRVKPEYVEQLLKYEVASEKEQSRLAVVKSRIEAIQQLGFPEGMKIDDVQKALEITVAPELPAPKWPAEPQPLRVRDTVDAMNAAGIKVDDAAPTPSDDEAYVKSLFPEALIRKLGAINVDYDVVYGGKTPRTDVAKCCCYGWHATPDLAWAQAAKECREYEARRAKVESMYQKAVTGFLSECVGAARAAAEEKAASPTPSVKTGVVLGVSATCNYPTATGIPPAVQPTQEKKSMKKTIVQQYRAYFKATQTDNATFGVVLCAAVSSMLAGLVGTAIVIHAENGSPWLLFFAAIAPFVLSCLFASAIAAYALFTENYEPEAKPDQVKTGVARGFARFSFWMVSTAVKIAAGAIGFYFCTHWQQIAMIVGGFLQGVSQP